MANIFYKNSVVKKQDIQITTSTKKAGQIYDVPKYIRNNIDFSDIPGKEFMIQEGDRLDLIAEQLYGSSNQEYWKALALYNNIGYLFDLVPGDIIKIPFDINKIIERL